MSRLIPVAAAALLLALVGCTSTDATPDAEALPCLDVDPAVGNSIAEGANDLPITPIDVAAVEAPALRDAYLVAMSFSAEGGSDEVGVWATTSIADESMSILAVDGYATSFTVWPNVIDGEELDATEPGVDDAIACLG